MNVEEAKAVLVNYVFGNDVNEIQLRQAARVAVNAINIVDEAIANAAVKAKEPEQHSGILRP